MPWTNIRAVRRTAIRKSHISQKEVTQENHVLRVTLCKSETAEPTNKGDSIPGTAARDRSPPAGVRAGSCAKPLPSKGALRDTAGCWSRSAHPIPPAVGLAPGTQQMKLSSGSCLLGEGKLVGVCCGLAPTAYIRNHLGFPKHVLQHCEDRGPELSAQAAET